MLQRRIHTVFPRLPLQQYRPQQLGLRAAAGLHGHSEWGGSAPHMHGALQESSVSVQRPGREVWLGEAGLEKP